MENQNLLDISDYTEFKIRYPEYKNLKVNMEAIKSVQDLATVVFTLLGSDAIRININNTTDDGKAILEKYFIEI